MRLAIDTICEEEGVGASVHAPGPEAEGPKAACGVVDANVNRDRAQERPAGAKELLKTLMLPEPAELAAYNWV